MLGNFEIRDRHFCCISLVATLIVGLWSLFFSVSEFAARRLVHEDGVVEWLQVLLLVLAAWQFLLMVKQYGSSYQSVALRYFFLLLLIGCLFIVGEELSWGQRLLGLDPSVFIKKFNKQHEYNLHNLRFFQPYRHWVLISFGLVSLAGTVSRYYIKRLHGNSEWLMLFPSDALSLVFFYIVLGGLFVEWGDRLIAATDGEKFARRFRFIAGRTSEIAEMFVAFTVFWYSFSIKKQLRNIHR